MKSKLLSLVSLLSVSLLVMGAALVVAYPSLPPQIPIFYSRTEGDSQIADLPLILVLPLIMVVITILNNLLKKKIL